MFLCFLTSVILFVFLFFRIRLFFFCCFSCLFVFFFFFSSRRRHTRCLSDWSSDVCSSDLRVIQGLGGGLVYGTAPALMTLGLDAGRGRALGFLTAAMGLAFSVGPIFAGQIGRASCRERV